MSDLRLGVDADTRQAEAKIAKLADRPIKLNLKDSISQPLGRITGQVSEFNKSLEASNARVLAFGASAGSIFAVQKALTATVKSAIEVEKALTDINVVLNVSSKSLAAFGGSLFKIAKDTGQSFDVVAVAATELARQGLGAEQTLRRTSDALILSRLSGLDTAKSVESLTAAINSFSKAGLTSTQIINKFANVDAAFAVSSADLAEAISRVGSTAQDVGVDIDQLIGLVTAAQQTTARGGAVIGNSLKTIFTRVQRSDTLDALEGVGVAVRDLEGNALPAVQILNNLAGSFKNLSSAQQAATAEAVGGVFQINILRATLGDLGKQYGVYDNALKISTSSANEAILRNEQLNTTLSALVNQTLVNFNQAAAEIGNIVFAPSVNKTLTAINSILEAFNQPKETEGAGTTLAKGILGGLGSYLSGPGLGVISTVILRLFGGLTTFGASALKTLLGISSGADKVAQAQSRVNAILAQNPQLIQAVISKELTLLQVEQQVLNVIRQQNAARATAATISSAIAPRVPAPRRYGGFIPNFADAEIMGARSEGYNAQRSFEVNNPVLGRVTVNNREKTNSVPVGGYPAGSFIVNPNQLGQVAGVPLESIERMKHKGFIPNFAKTIPNDYPEKTKPSTKLGLIYAQKAPLNKDTGGVATFGGYDIPIKFQSSGFSGKRIKKPKDADLEKQLGDYIVKFTNNFANKIFEPNGQLQKSAKITNANELSNIGSFKSITGTVFETAVDLAAGKINEGRGQNAGVDFASPNQFIRNLFNGIAASQLEAKVNADPAQLNSVAQKAIQNGLISPQLKQIITGELGGSYETQKKKAGQKRAGVRLTGGKYGGFIPNFAALEEAVQREKSAGIASSMIRIGADDGLRNNNNPMGLGVYNTRDEPSGLGQGISRRKSKGFVPNFAKGDKINFEGPAIALSIALPIITNTLQQFGGSIGKAGKSLSSFTDGLSFALTGASLFGSTAPAAVKALGGLAGAAIGAYFAIEKYNQELKDIQLDYLKTAAEQAADALNNFNGVVSASTPIINEMIQAQETGSKISEDSFLKLADQIGNLPINIQTKAQEQLSAGNFSGLQKTLNDTAASMDRSVKSQQLGEKIRRKDLNVGFSNRKLGLAQGAGIDLGGGVTTKNTSQAFTNDIYKSFEDAASDAQTIISNVFAGLNTTEREEANKLIAENSGNFDDLLQTLIAVSKETDTDTSSLERLREALADGATNGVKMSEALVKFSDKASKTASTVSKIKLQNLLPKTDLTGAGNILGGKESFINPQERYASISQFAAGASKYVEGSRRGDVDTKGRGAYEMLSNLVQSGNVNPKDLIGRDTQGNFTNGLAASAAEARKQQIMQGGAQYEEAYKLTLKPGQKADPVLMKQFKDMQDPLKAQALANQSIQEFLMTDAQKTYAAFAPTLQEMLGALELLKGQAEDPQIMEKLSVLNDAILGAGGKAEEARAQLGQTKEKFYGYDFEKTGQISAGSTLGKFQMQAAKGKFSGNESVAILESLDQAVGPVVNKNEENRLANVQKTTNEVDPNQIAANLEASKTTMDRINEVMQFVVDEISNLSSTIAKKFEELFQKLPDFLKPFFIERGQPGGDPYLPGEGPGMTVGGVSTDVGRYGGTPISEQMTIPYEPGRGVPNLPTFGNQTEGRGAPNLPTFENQTEQNLRTNPAGVTPPSEDQMNLPKGANGSVIPGTTASVNISPVNANINITSTPDTTTQATVAALQAVVAQANERIRILEGKSGEKTPPSQLVAAQQALA
jgi:TP901 family phage tail tape measure protein